jgi:heptosyltransferase-2
VRVLILKLGAIGDVIMAIPAAHALHAAGHQVDWVVGRAAAPILGLYPWITVIPVDDARILAGSKTQQLAEIVSLWRRLLGRHYDLIATLQSDPRYKLLTLPIRARRKLILSGQGGKPDRATQLLPGRHHTDEYARILLDRPDTATPTQLAPIPAENLPPNPLPLTAKSRIVLTPAGARNLLRDDALRRWPVESYVQLAILLLARGHEVVLSGGPQDTWAAPEFAALPVTDLIGKLSLLETLALLQSAHVTVTHDTGPLHMAGITQTAIVAMFGPTDPRGRLPQRHNTVALWGGEGFACRPCYDGRDFANCPNNACIQQITPAMVAGEVETFLKAVNDHQPQLPRVRTPKHTPIQISSANLP